MLLPIILFVCFLSSFFLRFCFVVLGVLGCFCIRKLLARILDFVQMRNFSQNWTIYAFVTMVNIVAFCYIAGEKRSVLLFGF